MISLINNLNVETYLKCIRNGENPPDTLLTLSILQKPGQNSREAQSIQLSELMLKVTTEAYLKVRRSEELSNLIPELRSDCYSRLKEDFSISNPDLESWSALFFRYFSSVNANMEELSSAANVVPQQFRRRVNQGLSFLVDLLRKKELENQRKQRMSGKSLPIPDFTRLIAVQPILNQLSQLMNQEDGPRMVSIEGMGGIGKTAVTRAFVSLPETTTRWTNILWISARQTALDDSARLLKLPEADSTLEDVTNRLANQLGVGFLTARSSAEKMEGIRAALNIQPSLVVIDNLETVNDYLHLIPALAELSGTSRFLITSRETLRNIPYVHVIQLAELDQTASYELLKMEVNRRGRSSEVQNQEFEELFKIIGGIPLAIKLAAAQLHVRPIAEILNEFKNADNGVDGFYRYIYWKIWQEISDPARHLLLSFLSADPEGEDLEFLQVMSGQEEKEFYMAVKELDQVSLLEISGTPSLPLYRLHRLTVTFLQTELLNFWDKTLGNLN